jgi:hypothetical protein
LRRTHTDATDVMTRTQVLKSFSLKSYQKTNAMKRYEKKNKQGESQRIPRSRSNRFAHLEEIMIGGNVYLDLLSIFPQIDSTSMGGKQSRESFFKVNNGGERG